MSKKFKSQASSARAASALTGGFGFNSSFQTSSSPLSYVTETPDLSQITEPNIVVAFKNLGKKDSTTKAKALEELQECCTVEIEQGILQAWADIYPRTSIDNSRRVRQLAHNLQGNLTVSAGKRIAPLLPKVIGSWLGGTFDSDKAVARNAQDALERSFTTPERRKALWKLYKDSLFDFVEDAITVQTPSTLSDERTTSADDVQAKYVRVVGIGMNMLGQLLRSGIENDLVTTLLSGKKIWEFVYHSDSYLRRSVCELLMIANEKYADTLLEWTTISTCCLSKGLNSNQVGSSRAYTAALLTITKHRPELWTSDYTAKTAVSKRLAQFLKLGSQNGPEDVWTNIASLIKIVPEQVWFHDNQLESVTTVAEAFRTGVTQPTERVNATAAWSAYLSTCLWLMQKLDAQKPEFAQRQLIPMVRQYVTKKEEAQWTISIKAVPICKDVLIGMIKQDMLSTFNSTWSEFTLLTIDEMKLSQPETSKDFRRSQDSVIDMAKRLYNIKSELLKEPQKPDVLKFLQEADTKLLDAAIQLLRNRNGKPYCAAGLIEVVATQSGFDKNNSLLRAFLKSDMPSLLESPSSEKLTSIALTCGESSVIDSLFLQKSANTNNALYYALSHVQQDDLSKTSSDRIIAGSLVNDSDRHLMLAVLQNPALEDLKSKVCDQIVQATSINTSSDVQEAALELLEEALTSSVSTKSLTEEKSRPTLLSNLLLISDSGSAQSDKASAITAKLNSKTGTGNSSTSIIQQQLEGEGIPLSVFTLFDLAVGVAHNDTSDLKAIIPTCEMWKKALQQHVFSQHPSSLSITNALQGAVYTVNPAKVMDRDVVRDQDDFSLIFRLILYTTKILTSEISSRLDTECLETLFQFYPQALQLVNEKLTIDDANEIWIQTTPEVLQEASDVLSEGNKAVQTWVGNEDFVKFWLNLLHSLNDAEPAAYTMSLAWIDIATQFIDQNGPSRLLQEYDIDLKTAHKPQSLLRSAALIAVLRDYLSSTPYGKRILNELVADVTEYQNGSIKSLVLLNILLNGDADSLDAIPSQRIVFLMKNLVRHLDDHQLTGAQAEIMKLLATIIPQVQDIYGEHWEHILNALLKLWSSDMDIPTMNASIKLFVRLKNLITAEDVNDDLQEVWTSLKSNLETGLLECLQQLGQSAHPIDQPRTITAELIRRLLKDVELRTDLDFFNLLSTSVEVVQSAAYEILHRAIPRQQEQLSVELILETQNPHLPQDLMIMVVDMESDPRRYLLAWKLIFDHFTNASFKLQEAYTTNIKESGHINNLMNNVCDVLKIASGRPIDAAKFDVANFTIDDTESADKELQWLAVHNFFNALLRVPSLAKDWFIEQKNRVKSPLEAWTQKYISPLIVAASLDTVNKWAITQSQDEEDKALVVKSSPRGTELTATIEIDPESPPISLAISLPGSYPLESPVVTSRTRVGVSEKNWQSWLRTIQIIIFSTGSIIEGLIAFRRNVQGALKGQTECAICYSIIGTDMQTPTKKCGTCKNMFHGTCLFRWFKSSNSSSCPLCRNNFNYA